MRIPEDLRRRTCAFVARHGIMRARDLLGVAMATLEELRVEYGRTQPAVIVRVTERMDALEREEAGAA